MNEENRNDLQEILTQTLNESKDELGKKFNIDTVNLTHLERINWYIQKCIQYIYVL